ncbi:MAG: MFS transporter [Deltaproteobacteria bacterium]|nr:MFS transporter [Deltaproteobacteria bacterium]
MNFSTTSLRLLLNTLIVSSASFMINPLLVIGGSGAFHTSYAHLSTVLVIALVAGNITALVATTFFTTLNYYIWLRLAMFGLFGSATLMAVSVYRGDQFGYWLFCIALVLLRIFMATATTLTRVMHTITNLHHSDCSRLFARASSFFGIGSAIGPVIGSYVYSDVNFFSVLALSALFFLVGSIAIASAQTIIREDLSKASLQQTEFKQSPALKKIFSLSRNAVFTIFVSILFFVLLGQSFGFIPVLLKELGHVEWIGTFFSINAALLIVLSEPVALFLNKTALKQTHKMILGLALMVLALSLFSLTSTTLFWLVIITLLYSLAEIIFQTYAMELIRRNESQWKIPATVSAYTFFTSAVGVGLGQYIGLVCYTHIGVRYLWSVWFIFGVVALFGLYKVSEVMQSQEKTPASVGA